MTPPSLRSSSVLLDLGEADALAEVAVLLAVLGPEARGGGEAQHLRLLGGGGGHVGHGGRVRGGGTAAGVGGVGVVMVVRARGLGTGARGVQVELDIFFFTPNIVKLLSCD